MSTNFAEHHSGLRAPDFGPGHGDRHPIVDGIIADPQSEPTRYHRDFDAEVLFGFEFRGGGPDPSVDTSVRVRRAA